MCCGAHLVILKQNSQLPSAPQRVDAETGLCTASITEAQAADRQVWGVIGDLMNDRRWSMDNCLHELTFMRQNVSSLLQLRPKMVKAVQWSSPSPKGAGKSFPKGKGKGAGKQQGKPSAMVNRGHYWWRNETTMYIFSDRTVHKKCILQVCTQLWLSSSWW